MQPRPDLPGPTSGQWYARPLFVSRVKTSVPPTSACTSLADHTFMTTSRALEGLLAHAEPLMHLGDFLRFREGVARRSAQQNLPV